jgi:hypothetical protein
MQASEYLAQAEERVTQAAGLRLGAATELEAAAELLARMRDHTRTFDPPTLERLRDLRATVRALQTNAAYGAALFAGLEQLSSGSFVGYSPAGIERAL